MVYYFILLFQCYKIGDEEDSIINLNFVYLKRNNCKVNFFKDKICA